MLTYHLEQRGSVTIYKYIYQQIKKDILEKVIIAGDKLPSKRAFALHHKISIITVENAYYQLCEEGYVYSIEKKGYFISDVFTMEMQQIYTHQENHKKFSIDIPKKSKQMINLALNGGVASLFPFTKWTQCIRKNISYQFEEVPFSGTYRLRLAISNYLFQFRRMNINPNNIVIGAGSEYLYHLLIFLFGKDVLVATEDPGHIKIRKIYSLFDVDILPIRIDENGLLVEELYKHIANIVHVSPTHHFPLGVSMPIKRRIELLNWASFTEDRYIIEDEYDTEFQYKMNPLASLQSMDTGSKVIYMNTFSKTISPSLRISYMILPDNLMNRLTEVVGFYSCTVPSLEQNTLAEFMESGYYESHINRLKKHYQNKHSNLIVLLNNSKYSDKFTIVDDNCGTSLILKLKTNINEDIISARAKEQGIVLSFLSQYYFEKPNEAHSIIINYSYLDNEIIVNAVDTVLEEL